jgi:hypothetical protein
MNLTKKRQVSQYITLIRINTQGNLFREKVHVSSIYIESRDSKDLPSWDYVRLAINNSKIGSQHIHFHTSSSVDLVWFPTSRKQYRLYTKLNLNLAIEFTQTLDCFKRPSKWCNTPAKTTQELRLFRHLIAQLGWPYDID